MDDTARMAKCLKVTDTRALTLAYKMPLADMECEWGLHVGRGRDPKEESSAGLRPGSATSALVSLGSSGPPPPLQASMALAGCGGAILSSYLPWVMTPLRS